MLIGVISDTHLAGKPLPERLIEELEGVDMILHAGDILEMSIIDQLENVAETHAVKGNMDYGEVIGILPESRVIEVGGFRIALTHGYGPPMGMSRKVRGMFDDVDCIVFGHTHEPLIEELDGVLLFNPGSPTDKMFAKVNTLGLLEVTDRLVPRLVHLEGPQGRG